MKTKLMTLILMITMIFSLASCGGFIVQEETIEIESIVPTLLEDGQTMVVITYKNDMQDPTVFYLPKGDNGIGIESIEMVEPEVEGNTAFEIVLTSGETKKIEVPQAVSIVDTTTITKEDGKYYLVIHFSDGSTDEVEIIPGPAGKDGLSIVNTTYQYVTKEHPKYEEYPNHLEIIFTFSDGLDEEYIQSVYLAPGKDGNGITDIYDDYNEENGKYYIVIEESNGSITPFEFPIVQWFSGIDEPSRSLGRNGDFYFNTSDGIIYRKSNNLWGEVSRLLVDDTQKNPCKVTLDLNDNDGGPKAGYSVSNQESWISVPYNSNLYSNRITLPTPHRTGYDFAGWYSSPKPTIVNGMFTDLTTVTENITIYAKWIPNKYTINFETNGGTLISSITQDCGSEVVQPVDPVKEGLVFAGWYTDQEFENAYSFTKMEAKNITLYAKWELPTE